MSTRQFAQTLTIASLCIFSFWYDATGTAGFELSRGRQLLLDRGLQIQGLAYRNPGPLGRQPLAGHEFHHPQHI